MGMFYTVKSEHRDDFTDTFGDVAALLADMDGHRKTDLLVNRENEDDMFIASRWDSRGDAMEFFRSDAFSETVEFGRDVLADRPRHVFWPDRRDRRSIRSVLDSETDRSLRTTMCR